MAWLLCVVGGMIEQTGYGRFPVARYNHFHVICWITSPERSWEMRSRALLICRILLQAAMCTRIPLAHAWVNQSEKT
jgi:hypothetical protein